MKFLLRNKIDLLFLGIFLLCCIPALIGLFHPGFFVSDDGNWMVIRFAAFYKVLARGEFPTRFLAQLNQGYGYPVADFLYPLFLYLGVPIKLIGISFVSTIKLILGFSLVFSGIFTYFWLRKVGFFSLSSFVGAVTYTLFPYHIYDIYTRGSVGEVLALCIVPFLFWQIELDHEMITCIAIALLILSHNTLALLFLPVVILYLFFVKSSSLLKLGKIVLFSIGLSAFFWLPALYDKQFTIFDQVTISNVSQYFITSVNFNLVSWCSFIVILGTFLFFLKKAPRSVYFFLVLSLIFLFFVFPISDLFWRRSFLTAFIQFPFRLISVLMVGVSFLTAYIVDRAKQRYIISCIFLLLLGLASYSYLFPTQYQTYPDGFYSTNQDTTTVKNEYMPRWVTRIPLHAPDQRVSLLQGKGTIAHLLASGVRISFSTTLLEKSTLRINRIYFPGMYVKVNGMKHSFSYDNQYGVMDLSLEKGNYLVQVGFGETPVRLFADLITLGSIGICCFVFLNKRLRKTDS